MALTRVEWEAARRRTVAMFQRAGIVLRPSEEREIEVADFGLEDLERMGLEVLTYINTPRYCAKDLALFPHQTCPQHRHPPVGAGDPGKEETFRCRYGEVTLYLEGPPSAAPRCRPPAGEEQYYTVWREINLRPGGQFTIPPNTWHWFQAGPDGAVVSEFSSQSMDEFDEWTDPRIDRRPMIVP